MVKNNSRKSKNLKILIFCSLLAAAGVVLGQYLSIKIGNSIRIGFGNLPVIMAGCMFGPLAGASVGIVSDIIGAISFYGIGSVNPIITLAMAVEGILAGLIGRKLTATSLVAADFSAHIVGAAVIKSIGLWIWYRTPALQIWLRVGSTLIEAVIESVLLVALFCSNTVVIKNVRKLSQ